MNRHVLNCRVTPLSSKRDTNLQFHIDAPLDTQEVSEQLLLQGWAIHQTQKIVRIFFLSEKQQTVGSTVPEILRPLVHKHFEKFRNSNSAGFDFTISKLVAGEYSLIAETEDNKRYTLAKISLQETCRPKLLFMHIAKTAGSSVNKYLASHYAKDRYAIHIESEEKWQKNRDWAKNLGFVSGHINLPRFNRVLDLAGYYKVTLVREPYAHLVSHLAWIRKLADESECERLARHPLFVQHFAGKLADTDLSKPSEIVRLITMLEDKEKQLVDNCQTRYFTQVTVGQNVCAEDARCAMEASAEFDRIGTTDNIDRFLMEVAKAMEWTVPNTEVRENVSGNYYGLDASDRNIRAALEPLVHHDLKLYRFIIDSQG